MKRWSTDRSRSALILFAITTGLTVGAAGCGPTNGLPPLTGEFLYASSESTGNLYELSINTSTGLLTYMNQILVESPHAVGGPVAIHPSNEFIYDAMEVGANGAPAELDGLDIGDGTYSGLIFGHNSSVFIGGGAGTGAGIALDPPGRCAYVSETHGISRYSIDQKSGAVSVLGETPVAAGGVFGIAVQPKAGSVVLVTRRDNQTLYDFKTGAECNLVANGNLLLSEDFSDAEDVAFHPTLLVAYVTDPHLHRIFEIAINPDLTVSLLGTVTPPLSSPGEPGPFNPVVHPSGNYLYVADEAEISEFAIDSSGLLSWKSSVTQGVQYPASMVIDASGKFLYAANFQTFTIAMFAIDPDTGALTPNPAPPGTNTIVVAPNTSDSIGWITTTH